VEYLLHIPLMKEILLAESNGMTFWEALPILRNGILACLGVAILCSFLGVYVILKRIVFVSAALSQISSLGIAISFLLNNWMTVGREISLEQAKSERFLTLHSLWALLFACMAASLLAARLREHRLTRESLLGILYAVPAGLVLLILDRTTKDAHEIENVLFGNAVFVSTPQLLFLILTALGLLGLHGLFYKQFIFTAFDPDTARAAGLKTQKFNQLFFLTLAIAVSVSITSIGALPVFSYMILPAASALLLFNRLHTTFVVAEVFGFCSALIGFYVSFLFSLPTGPTLLASAALFLIPGLVLAALRGAGN